MKVRALLTADIGNSNRRQFPVSNIEAYMISTALDSDADEFSVDIGSMNGDLAFLLNRDNEVLVSLFTSGPHGTLEPLHQGIADIVAYSSGDNILSIKGRDYSAVAADSQAPPGETQYLRPAIFVGKEARELGITKLKLAAPSQIKLFDRDGSETYWESWYRIYRQKKMWMWTEPDGELTSGYLNYTSSPSYYFGRPTSGSNNPSAWIPIENIDVSKSTQGRVGKIFVYGVHEKTNIGFRYPLGAPLADNTISQWVKRPLKIITSTTAKDVDEAKTEAFEEIFEGKVGAVEFQVRVSTDIVIRQNTMAYVNVPDAGIRGLFYIVGVTRSGDASGNVQVVRMREKYYAISKRVPPDPSKEQDPLVNQTPPGDVATQLTGIRWASAFTAAAQEFHDGWDYKLFLAVLLSIAWVEGGGAFANVRNPNTGGEWKPKPNWGPTDPVQWEAARKKWEEDFANDIHNPKNPRSHENPPSEAAVGPMQLLSSGYKDKADEYGNNHDEYSGGRWVPEYNIRAGAWAFATEKLSGVDPSKPANIWIGVERYYGSTSNAANVAYRNKVFAAYDKNPGFKDQVAQIELGGASDTITDSNGTPITIPNPAGAPEKIKTFISVLKAQMGKPYEWGADGPNSFDCSGLVRFAAAKAGITGVVGNTYILWGNTTFTPVADDNLLLGDLVFFNSQDHMGVYLADRQFIAAPRTGKNVGIFSMDTDYYKSVYDGARRMLPWGVPHG